MLSSLCYHEARQAGWEKILCYAEFLCSSRPSPLAGKENLLRKNCKEWWISVNILSHRSNLHIRKMLKHFSDMQRRKVRSKRQLWHITQGILYLAYKFFKILSGEWGKCSVVQGVKSRAELLAEIFLPCEGLKAQISSTKGMQGKEKGAKIGITVWPKYIFKSYLLRIGISTSISGCSVPWTPLE